MPVTINGIGVSMCEARGFVQWHKRAFLTEGDCDAVVCFVFVFIPLVPINAIHAFNRGGTLLNSRFDSIPIRNAPGLFLRAFLWKFTWALCFIGLITFMFMVLAIRDQLHFIVPLLLGMVALACPVGCALGQLWLRASDRRYADLRYLLGRHRFGSSDPATWNADLLDEMQSPKKLFGTPCYSDAALPLLERGEYSQAMWAARLATAFEDEREGEQLTRTILADPGVQRAVAEVRREPERWAELMTRPSAASPATARSAEGIPTAVLVEPPRAIPVATLAQPAQAPSNAIHAGQAPRVASPAPVRPALCTVDDAAPLPPVRTQRSDPSKTVLLIVGAIAVVPMLLGCLIAAFVLAVTLSRRPAAPPAEPEVARGAPPVARAEADRTKAERPAAKGAPQEGKKKGRSDRSKGDPEALVPNAPSQPPAPPDVAGKKTVDLIPLIQPARDAVHGRWAVDKNVLHCNDAHFVPRIEIPYRPPEEYDFVVTFSQSELRNGISLVMPRPGGGSFFWFFGAENGTAYGFHANPNKEQRLFEPIQTNVPYTTVVQVRKRGVRGLLNGKVLLEVHTDYQDLLCDGWRQIRDQSLLAVCCDDPTVFHYVHLIEITGAGKQSR
jgi:hypothetical protein